MNLDITSLEKAVTQLENTLDAYESKLMQENPEYKIYMRGAVIQAFEFTYELTLKMLRRHLATSLFDPKEADSMSFKRIVREAYAKNLVYSDVSVWDQYRQNRGITSHTYDEDKAQVVFESVSKFLDEARYVLSSLQDAHSVPSMATKKATKRDLEAKIAELESKISALASKIESNKGSRTGSPKKRSTKTRRS